MPPDLEPASALASVESAEDFAVRVAASYTTWHNAGALVAARDAAVREPLERQLGELANRYEARIASLEAQLASAREEALREAIAAVDTELDTATDAYADAHERSYDLLILFALTNQCGGLRHAKKAIEALASPLPPPAVQKEPHGR